MTLPEPVEWTGGVARALAALMPVRGVYLHGSLAFGCFNPRRSDVDLLVVAPGAMEEAVRREVARLALQLSTRPYPIELSVLVADDLRPWQHPAPYDFHWSEHWRGDWERRLAAGLPPPGPGVDADLAVHVALTRERGVVLFGEPANAMLPGVPAGDVADSLMRDLHWIEGRSTRDYGVLNLCRMRAYARGQGLLSKATGARWWLDEGGELAGTVRTALAVYEGEADESGLTADEVRRFVAAVAPRVGEELRARRDSP